MYDAFFNLAVIFCITDNLTCLLLINIVCIIIIFFLGLKYYH